MKKKINVQELSHSSEIFSLATNNQVLILKVTYWGKYGFNEILIDKMRKQHGANFHCATIHIKDLPKGNDWIDLQIQTILFNSNLAPNAAYPTGYYLFYKSFGIGYHPNVEMSEQLETKLFASTLTAVLKRDFLSGMETFSYSSLFYEAVKIKACFNKKITDHKRKTQQHKNKTYHQELIIDKELLAAYALLEIKYGATLQEVKAARNALVHKYHPDKTSDSNTAYTAQIIKAYKLIEQSLKDQDLIRDAVSSYYNTQYSDKYSSK